MLQVAFGVLLIPGFAGVVVITAVTAHCAADRLNQKAVARHSGYGPSP
jgi:hypothetical protein